MDYRELSKNKQERCNVRKSVKGKKGGWLSSSVAAAALLRSPQRSGTAGRSSPAITVLCRDHPIPSAIPAIRVLARAYGCVQGSEIIGIISLEQIQNASTYTAVLVPAMPIFRN